MLTYLKKKPKNTFKIYFSLSLLRYAHIYICAALNHPVKLQISLYKYTLLTH